VAVREFARVGQIAPGAARPQGRESHRERIAAADLVALLRPSGARGERGTRGGVLALAGRGGTRALDRDLALGGDVALGGGALGGDAALGGGALNHRVARVVLGTVAVDYRVARLVGGGVLVGLVVLVAALLLAAARLGLGLLQGERALTCV